MPNYFYIAKNLKGELRSGSAEVKDERELARTLRKEGYILVSARSEENVSGKKNFGVCIPFFSKISLVDKIMFTRNLRVMVGAGVSLPRALEILIEQTKNKRFKKVISEIKKAVFQGKNFSQALSRYPDIFDELFVNMIKVGEESGTLEEILKILTEQMSKEHQIISRVRGAMMYPVVILLTMCVIGVLMMITIIPKLSKVFFDLKIKLPVTTRFIIAFSNFAAEFWHIIAVAVVIILFLIRNFLKTEIGKTIRDTILFKIPIFSSIIKKTNSAQTVRTISSLIEAGVPIVKSLEITSKTLGNIYYKRALLKASQEIKKGNKLADVLGQYKNIYPNLVVQMIKVGEETGETALILKQLAEFYEEEVTNVTKNLSSIIEPILMIIIGAAVGFFAVSIIQPIYGIVQGF